MFGIVLSVAILPVSRQGMTNLTAVRMRTKDGVQSRFFADSALAPTLKEGEWVTCKVSRTDSEWGDAIWLVDYESRLHALATAPSANAVEVWLVFLKVALSKSWVRLASAPPEGSAMQNLATETFERISHARTGFGLKSGEYCLPDEVLLDLVPGAIQVQVHAYLEHLRHQDNVASDAS